MFLVLYNARATVATRINLVVDRANEIVLNLNV